MKLSRNKNDETWLQYYWRPAFAWVYLCAFDFIIAPLLTGVYYVISKGNYVPWEPLTLKEGGFFHITMGSVTGVTAWTRGQEKLKKMDQDQPQSDPPSQG